MATFHEALKHKNRLSPVLLKRAEVMGVGVGYADPKKPTSGASVIVYTHQKIVPSGLNNLKSVASKIGSICACSLSLSEFVQSTCANGFQTQSVSRQLLFKVEIVQYLAE